MRSVAVFRWLGELPSDNLEKDPERWTTLLSRPAAETLFAVVCKRGYATEPWLVDGDGGWHFSVNLAGQNYSVFTLWTGIGNPDDNYLACQLGLRKGCVGVLFSWSYQEENLEPMCRVLDDAFAEVPFV